MLYETFMNSFLIRSDYMILDIGYTWLKKKNKCILGDDDEWFSASYASQNLSDVFLWEISYCIETRHYNFVVVHLCLMIICILLL